MPPSSASARTSAARSPGSPAPMAAPRRSRSGYVCFCAKTADGREARRATPVLPGQPHRRPRALGRRRPAPGPLSAGGPGAAAVKAGARGRPGRVSALVCWSGCGADTTTADRRSELEAYVAKVQPIRLGINELLDKADPILEGYRDGDLSAEAGAARHRPDRTRCGRICGPDRGRRGRTRGDASRPGRLCPHLRVPGHLSERAPAGAARPRIRRATPLPERAAGGDHRLAHAAPGARRPLGGDAPRRTSRSPGAARSPRRRPAMRSGGHLATYGRYAIGTRELTAFRPKQ